MTRRYLSVSHKTFGTSEKSNSTPDQLVRQGAERPLDLGQDLDTWLRDALSRVARRVKHRGNHRYLWALDRRLRRAITALALVDESGDPDMDAVREVS